MLLFFRSLVLVVAAPADAVAVSSTDIFGGGGGGAGLLGVFALIDCSGIGLSCLWTGDCDWSWDCMSWSAVFMTESGAFITESTASCASALTADMGTRFSWSWEAGCFSSSLCGVLRNLRMGAPRSGTLLIRKLGAGVTVSCTGVPDPLRETRNFGFRVFSGEFASFCASSAVVNALSFMGCGISSSDESPMSIFCIIGALAAKP